MLQVDGRRAGKDTRQHNIWEHYPAQWRVTESAANTGPHILDGRRRVTLCDGSHSYHRSYWTAGGWKKNCPAALKGRQILISAFKAGKYGRWFNVNQHLCLQGLRKGKEKDGRTPRWWGEGERDARGHWRQFVVSLVFRHISSGSRDWRLTSSTFVNEWHCNQNTSPVMKDVCKWKKGK